MRTVAAMNFLQNIHRWRALTSDEQRRLRLAGIPQKVARSMAFAGEPVPADWMATQQRRLAPSATV